MTKRDTNDLVEYEDDDDYTGSNGGRRDSFDARLLRGYNDSVVQLPPAAVRDRSTAILSNRDEEMAAGINKSVFTASQELSEIVKPRRGVRLRSDRGEFPGGRYEGEKSRMSTHEYAKLAEQYRSLGSIHATPRDGAKRGDALNSTNSFSDKLMPLAANMHGMRSQPVVDGRLDGSKLAPPGGYANISPHLVMDESSRDFLHVQSEIDSSIADGMTRSKRKFVPTQYRQHNRITSPSMAGGTLLSG